VTLPACAPIVSTCLCLSRGRGGASFAEGFLALDEVVGALDRVPGVASSLLGHFWRLGVLLDPGCVGPDAEAAASSPLWCGACSAHGWSHIMVFQASIPQLMASQLTTKPLCRQHSMLRGPWRGRCTGTIGQGLNGTAQTWVLRSRTGMNRPISEVQGGGTVREAVTTNELTGKMGPHAMRKTFANQVDHQLNHDLVKTQRAMGDRTINSTVAYLSFVEDEIHQAILPS
jgi:hypothetical protein